MLTETIKNYKFLAKNVDKIIEVSGFRKDYIMKELQMDRTSFYKKRKEAKFTVDEMERLFEIINVDRLEDKILAQLSEDAEKEGTFVRYEGIKNLLQHDC